MQFYLAVHPDKLHPKTGSWSLGTLFYNFTSYGPEQLYCRGILDEARGQFGMRSLHDMFCNFFAHDSVHQWYYVHTYIHGRVATCMQIFFHAPV